MSTRDPKPVMVIGEGKCKLIHEAKCNQFDCSQEPLPESMRVLLCLIDGAERRHKLITTWAGQDDPSQGFDSDEGLEAILRRELIDIACFCGVSVPEALRDIV
jgi:hypothetical protein